MEHGVSFTTISGIEKHSLTDWGLWLQEQKIPMPSPRMPKITIPYMDGDHDFTTQFGEVRYDNRSLTFDFITNENTIEWDLLKSQIAAFLHGQKMKISVWSDPEYYYIGRCEIDDLSSDRHLRKIVISCDVAPYKLKTTETTKNLVSGSNTVTNERKTVKASLRCTSTVTVNGTTFAAGAHPNIIILTQGDNIVTSSGPCVLTFREGAL